MVKSILTTIQSYFDEGFSTRHIKISWAKKYPEQLRWIECNTHLSKKSSIYEIKFCLENNLLKAPVCDEQSCKNHVGWHNGNNLYCRWCSIACSSPNTIKVCQTKANKEQMKISREQTMVKRYGVVNANNVHGVKGKQSEKAFERWEEKFQGKERTYDSLTKQEYKYQAMLALERTYNRHKDIIDPEGKRSLDWNVDHVYSLTDGFLNDVPIEIISHVSNLKLITRRENAAKYMRSDKTLDELYEDYKKWG